MKVENTNKNRLFTRQDEFLGDVNVVHELMLPQTRNSRKKFGSEARANEACVSKEPVETETGLFVQQGSRKFEDP